MNNKRSSEMMAWGVCSAEGFKVSDESSSCSMGFEGNRLSKELRERQLCRWSVSSAR
jgi:hypothetical protein